MRYALSLYYAGYGAMVVIEVASAVGSIRMNDVTERDVRQESLARITRLNMHALKNALDARRIVIARQIIWLHSQRRTALCIPSTCRLGRHADTPPTIPCQKARTW